MTAVFNESGPGALQHRGLDSALGQAGGAHPEGTNAPRAGISHLENGTRLHGLDYTGLD